VIISSLIYEKVLAEIDATCCVLEPVQPTFSIPFRRIVINKSCSVVVELNPDEPRKVYFV
jgi:hypothetical protein